MTFPLRFAFAALLCALVGGSWFAAMRPDAVAQQAKPAAARPAGKPVEARPVPPVIERDIAALPAPVAKMRARILTAARSGDIEQMRIPIEVNELAPILARGGKGDPVAQLRGRAADPEGREVLARLVNVLEQGFARTDPGREAELFVFPWFAAVPLDGLSPEDLVEVYRIVPAALVKESLDRKKYLGDRLAIGKDGTWHYFLSGE